MWHCSKAHHSPSLIIESTTSLLPSRRPSRTRGNRYGQLLIDSMPPATATSMSPAATACAASMTAFRPEPHTLLIVSAATCSGSPPRSAACRAGFWPSPAETTLPMMHSSTIAGSRPARRTASATTSAPSWGAVNALSAPKNLPVGVRTALTMTDSRMGGWFRGSGFLVQGSGFKVPGSRLRVGSAFGVRSAHGDAGDRVLAEERLEPGEDDIGGARHLARPL